MEVCGSVQVCEGVCESVRECARVCGSVKDGAVMCGNVLEAEEVFTLTSLTTDFFLLLAGRYFPKSFFGMFYF